MQWLYMHISYVLNARSRILEGVRIAHKPWISLKTKDNLSLNNWSAQIVAKFHRKTAPNTAKTLLNLNANFVVQQPNGFAGETLTFVNPAIKGSAMGIMWANTPKTNYQNVLGVNHAQSVGIMGVTENKNR